MSKIIRLGSNCIDNLGGKTNCPYCEEHRTMKICTKKERQIERVEFKTNMLREYGDPPMYHYSIPSWCPLEDAPEEVKK